MRGLNLCHLYQRDSQRPDISLVIIWGVLHGLAHHYLWSHPWNKQHISMRYPDWSQVCIYLKHTYQKNIFYCQPSLKALSWQMVGEFSRSAILSDKFMIIRSSVFEQKGGEWLQNAVIQLQPFTTPVTENIICYEQRGPRKPGFSSSDLNLPSCKLQKKCIALYKKIKRPTLYSTGKLNYIPVFENVIRQYHVHSGVMFYLKQTPFYSSERCSYGNHLQWTLWFLYIHVIHFKGFCSTSKELFDHQVTLQKANRTITD